MARDDFRRTTFDILGGVNTLDNPGSILQNPKKPLLMAQANNVFAPNQRFDLQTRPGMDDVRATAIHASGVFTGMIDQGEMADRFLLIVSDGSKHSVYQNSANPPAEITGGTNLTVGQDVLTDLAHFHDGSNPGTILVSRSKDLPQFINNSGTRSDFTIAGTGLTSLKPEILTVGFQRAFYGDVNLDGTVFDDRVYWSAIRDGNLIDDPTNDFESFETRDKDKVRMLRGLSDLTLVGKLNNIFSLVPTPEASESFAQEEEPGGRFKGPVSQQGSVAVDQMVFWMGQHDIHSFDKEFRIRDWAPELRSTIDGFNDARREFTIAGYDSSRDLVIFAVSDGSDTTHKTMVALNIKTGMKYIWTISANAMANRIESGEARLYMGGYVGLFRHFGSTATGNLDDASAAIDADIFSPRHHLGIPDWVKLFGGVIVEFDQQGTSEAVTVQYRLNDDSSWSSFAESPYTVGGTAGDVNLKFFPLMAAGTHLQLRFRDANSGQVIRIQKYTLLWKPMHPAVIV